jgi:peptidoglycan LD-endopeptidase LytH
MNPLNTLQRAFGLFGVSLLLGCAGIASAQPFQLPTGNRALFEPGGEERFFAGTAGKPWTSGTFGCVRSDGWQLHEGIDIRSVQHDKRGEPTDPVMATAEGTVVYVNPVGGLSNYGKYVVLRHQVEGLEVYSLYAHLSAIRSGMKVGQGVKAGETIATMGRTSNTRSGISRDRAHVHFEVDLLVNDRFAEWFKRTHPGERNDHGLWNGHNLLGLDPRRLFLDQQAQGKSFTLRGFIRTEPELFRVLVSKSQFPWLHRYAALMEANPSLGSQAPGGYELVCDYNGVPYRLIPRPASDFKGRGPYHLLSVNEAEYERNHCRRLVVRQGHAWQLTAHGQGLLDQLTY